VAGRTSASSAVEARVGATSLHRPGFERRRKESGAGLAGNGGISGRPVMLLFMIQMGESVIRKRS
jgi:hypothetical protein